MNKIKTLSAIIFFACTFTLASCSSDDTYEDISAGMELNVESTIDPPQPNGDEDDPKD